MFDTVRTDAEILALLADNTSGQIGAQDVRDAYVTQRATTGALADETESFTLSLSHLAKGVIRCSHASTPIVVTIPTNASAAFPLNTVLNFTQWGAAVVSFAAADGVTLRKPSENTADLRSQYSVASLWKADTNEWLLFGSLADA